MNQKTAIEKLRKEMKTVQAKVDEVQDQRISVLEKQVKALTRKAAAPKPSVKK